MNLPFTQTEFLGAFGRYNEAVWPAHLVLNAAAIVAVLAIVQRWRHRDALASGILAFLWLWSGVVYHALFFARVSPAGFLFAAAFVVQALALVRHGVGRRSFMFLPHAHRMRELLGAFAIIYALVLYPMLANAFGQEWPQMPTFGAPCPLVLFTFGLMMWTEELPKSLLIVPVGWAGVATVAALELGIHEDLMLPVFALITVVALLVPPHRTPVTREQT